MKKLLLSLTFAFVFLTPFSLLAQSNALKLNFISPVFKTFTFSYEHAFRYDKSFQLTGYYNAGEPFDNGNDSKMGGYGFALDYRIYLSGGDLEGFYFGPFMRLKRVWETREDYYYYDPNTNTTTYNYDEYDMNATIGGIGFLFGGQLVMKDAITMDFFLGPGYEAYLAKDYEYNYNYGMSNPLALSLEMLGGYHIRGGMTVGFVF